MPGFVEKPEALWQCCHAMASKSTCTGLIGKGIFALLIVSVVSSGIPMVEVHAHENATFGHSHDAHEFFDDHGAAERETADGDADTTSLHAHDVNATSVTLISSVSVDVAEPVHAHSHIPPPYNWLPDNIVAPLYRPPIA